MNCIYAQQVQHVIEYNLLQAHYPQLVSVTFHEHCHGLHTSEHYQNWTTPGKGITKKNQLHWWVLTEMVTVKQFCHTHPKN